MVKAALALILLASCRATVVVDSRGRSARANLTDKALTNRTRKAFLRTPQFKHRLRICNAYPLPDAVEVFQGKELLTKEPIAYRSCHEVTSPVKAGDKLQFRIGGVGAGSFMVSELPGSDAVLVLVIYQHSSTGSAVAFESHVFANLVTAQIAVLDTYRGTKKATLRVQDAKDAKTSRSEEVRFDSVISVNPGIYEVILQGEDGETQAKQELVALNSECYVIVRCGLESEEGEEVGREYPQELMVYPHSDRKVLLGGPEKSGAPGRRSLAAPALLLAALGLALAAG